MDRDELVRLAGEQALLKKELSNLSAEQNRDKQALQNLHSDVDRHPNWLPGGLALLQRLAERQRTMADSRRRLDEYRSLTGLD
jgi:hypothetical protein